MTTSRNVFKQMQVIRGSKVVAEPGMAADRNRLPTIEPENHLRPGIQSPQPTPHVRFSADLSRPQVNQTKHNSLTTRRLQIFAPQTSTKVTSATTKQ
jgi:hypothetical protein